MTDRTRISVDHLVTGAAPCAGGAGAILVEDSRIVVAGPEEQVPRPADARALVYPGATALPGLIDGHVHLTVSWESVREETIARYGRESDADLIARASGAAERMLRTGVTTAFSCGERGATAFAIRDAIARGVILGPRLLVAGPPVTPTGGHCGWMGGEADGEAGVRAAIDRLVEQGADGIKIMATGGHATQTTDPALAAYPTAVLAAAASQAHHHGRRITAHAHGVPGMRAAVEAGIDSLEHASMLGPGGSWTFDEGLAREMAAKGVRALPSIAADTRGQIGGGPGWSRLDGPVAFRVPVRMANARRLREAGVPLVLGTDGTDFEEAIHLELEAFVAIGLDPCEAIRSATLDAAAHLNIDGITGTLEPGKAADILVVDGDARTDITLLRHPLAVVAAGRLVQPTPPPPSPGRLAW